jgi:hypothetical protein
MRVIPGYTADVKTAISVPDEIFARVEASAARLQISRSEFYATAAKLWLDSLDQADLTSDIDDALARLSDADRAESSLLTASAARRLAVMTEADEW